MGELRDVAVIDVGSNSVRLVLYRVDGRAIWTTYNEKVLAGLGRDLGRTGRLSPEGVDEALCALRRFRAVVGAYGAREILTAATAAVRDAQDGPAFVARVREETGLELRVLSGEEEARFAALGVVAGQTDVEGVVGDLGGSSLEFVRLTGATPAKGVTLPLGPLALGAGVKGGGFDAAALRRAIAKRLAPCAAAFRTDRFYAVGGAWRNLALLHMAMTGYPLRVVQQYEVDAGELLATADALVRQPKLASERIPGVSRKRAETLPYAALVLEGVIGRLGVQRVALCAYGLREGLILDGMDAETRARDPLVEGCASLGARQGLSAGLGPALEAWLAPMWRSQVFGQVRGRTLMAAAARLADLGAALHPDHRGLLTHEQVLRAPMAGCNHAERAYLAQAVLSRYGGDGVPEPVLMSRVIGPEAQAEAKALGLALRLGCDLCGRSPARLERTRVSLGGGVLRLEAEADARDLLVGEQIRKRLLALAEALGAKVEAG